MAPLIHLCRKDYSFAKHVLLGSWVVFLVAALMPRFITGALVNAAAPILGLVFAAPLFLVFAATLRILRADSFTGGNAFIGTRPVTMTMLWFSKLVAIAAFVLCPYLLAQVIGVWALRVHLTPADWVLFLAEKKLLFGLPAAIALIVGTHTRNFVWTTLLTLAFAVLMIWLAAAIFGRPGGFNFLPEARQLKASQWLVAQVLISTAAILLAWLWMARRRMAWSIGAGGLALAVIAGVSMQWQGNFVKQLARSELDATIVAGGLRIAWLGEPRISSSSRNNVPFTTVIREAKVEGVADGWLANPSGVRSKARFRDGGMIAGEAINSGSYGDFSRALLPSLGIEFPLDHPRRSDSGRGATWFEAATSLLRDRTDTTSTISGECEITLDQPVVLANLPAVSGTSASHGRFRYRIEQVEASGGGISLKLAVYGVDLASRGDWRNKQDDIEILLINRKTGEHTTIGRMSGSSSAGFGWMTLQRDLRIDDWPDRQTTDPQAFLKDARLYLIGSRHGGTVRIPFEIPEIRLEETR
jgi:hypothetical protein